MDNTQRVQNATALCAAVAECEPEDAVFMMEGILGRMRAGMPIAYFDSLRSEAESWAALSSRHELKAYLWAAFHALPASDRAAFIRRVSK